MTYVEILYFLKLYLKYYNKQLNKIFSIIYFIINKCRIRAFSKKRYLKNKILKFERSISVNF